MFRRKKHDAPGQPEAELRCSFCDKGPHQVRKLIAGPVAYICDQCVAVCVDIIAEDARAQAGLSEAGKPSEPGQRVRVSEPRWSSPLRCSLCRMPVVVEEALSLEGRGVLCLACIADVQAAAAARGDGDERTGGER